MARQTEHLVGRAEELEFARSRLGRGRPGRLGGDAARRRAGHRQDAAAGRARRGAPTRAGTSCSRARPPSSSATCRSASSSTRSTSTCAGSGRAGSPTLDDDVRSELAHVFPSLTALAGGRRLALQHERYRSHRAVRALLERLAATQPLVLVLDDLHWADAASIELLGALLRRPPAAPVLLALAMRPRHVPERLSQRARARAARRPADRHRAAARSPRRRRASSSATRSTRRRGRALRGERRQPVLPRAARAALDRERRGGAARDETSLAAIGVPPIVAAALAEELALLSGRTRARAGGRGGGGRPVRARAGRGGGRSCPRRRRWTALDELLRLDLVRHDRRAAALPLPPPARAPRGLRGDGRPAGGSAPTSAAPRRSRRAGPPASARAHHVERSARQGDAGAVAVLREAGEEAVRARPRERRALVRARRCACARRPRRPRSASSSCSRGRGR